VTSFAPCKATPVLVEAFLALAATRPDVRLRMVGDGAERPRCEQIAARSAHADQLLFTGYRSDVDVQLGQSDVFVLPSLNENSPLALLQAMARGLACIATNVGGIPEILGEDSGLLVPPGDARSLQAAMERLLDEPGLVGRLGTAARQRVAARYSLTRCADDHLRLWSELLGTGRA
jgi:glycosyltransferase involved in cell wall biosynthesis